MSLAKVSAMGLVLALVVSLGAHRAAADDAAKKVKTITGTSSCGGCSGVSASCSMMLTDADGVRWVLTGKCPTLKTAFKDRAAGKTFTCTIVGDPETKKGKDGKEYKEATVKDVKVVEKKSEKTT